MPLRLAAEELVLTEPRTVVLAEQTFVLTEFQHRLWQKLNARTRLAVGAPTSAGKSFVLGNFLVSRLAEGEQRSLVYIVPTRALIAQVSDDLVRRIGPLPADRVKTEVVTVPIEADGPLPRFAVYVMTQERVQMMLANHPEFRAEIVVVDEAHSISEGSRGNPSSLGGRGASCSQPIKPAAVRKPRRPEPRHIRPGLRARRRRALAQLRADRGPELPAGPGH